MKKEGKKRELRHKDKQDQSSVPAEKGLEGIGRSKEKTGCLSIGEKRVGVQMGPRETGEPKIKAIQNNFKSSVLYLVEHRFQNRSSDFSSFSFSHWLVPSKEKESLETRGL